MQTKWLNISNTTEGVSADIYLFDVIDEWFGIGKKSFIDQVNAINANNITLHISSPGGDVDSALAMHDFIKSHPAKVTAKLTGVVASAATFLALAADKVEMSENALFMIHNVWSVVQGTAEDMRAQADVIDKVEERIINIYQKKTGMRKAAIQQLVDAETWMDAAEAKNYGFVDRIISPSKMAAKATVESLQSRGFQNIPKEKLDLLNNEPDMNFKEEMEALYNRIVENFQPKPKADDAPVVNVVEVKVLDSAEFQNKVTELNSKFDEQATALQNAIDEVAQLKAEKETLTNEVARLSGSAADETPNADPIEPGSTPAESPYKAMAKQLADFAKNKKN